MTGPPYLHLREAEHAIGPTPNILGGLNPIQHRRIDELTVRLSFAAGEAVFRQGELHTGIYIIESGAVRSYYTGPSGREITLAYWTPGNFNTCARRWPSPPRPSHEPRR